MGTKSFIIYIIIFICSISLGIIWQFQCRIIRTQPITVEIKPEEKPFDIVNVPTDSSRVSPILKKKFPAKQAYYVSTVTFKDSNFSATVDITSIEPLPPNLIAGIDFKLLTLPTGECNCDESFIDNIQEASFYIILGEIFLLTILWITGGI